MKVLVRGLRQRDWRKKRALKKVTSDNARVACVWCGALAYFSDRCAIDMLGKSDKKIAREPMHLPAGSEKWTGFYPGHLKWDYYYSIEQLRPDIVAQLWKEPADAARFLKEDYVYVSVAGQRFFARKDSSKIRWELIHSLGGTSIPVSSMLIANPH